MKYLTVLASSFVLLDGRVLTPGGTTTVHVECQMLHPEAKKYRGIDPDSLGLPHPAQRYSFGQYSEHKYVMVAIRRLTTRQVCGGLLHLICRSGDVHVDHNTTAGFLRIDSDPRGYAIKQLLLFNYRR